MQVLGNRDLLSLICKQILAVENFEVGACDVPLRALSALSRVCRRTRELLALHPDLVCARRVKKTAFICQHQMRNQKEDYCSCDVCADNPYECGNSNRRVYNLDPTGRKRVLFCVCKCHTHICPWCVGPLQQSDWSEKKNLQSWRVTQKECADFQRYQYAYAIEGNFAVASFYLGRCAAYAQDFPTRVCRAEDLRYALLIGHPALYRACAAQDEFYPPKDMHEKYSMLPALLSGDADILRDNLGYFATVAEQDGFIVRALESFLTRGAALLFENRIYDWNLEKARAERLGLADAWNTSSTGSRLQERTNWESKRRVDMARLHAAKQLSVVNEFVQSMPSLRAEFLAKGASMFAQITVDTAFARHVVKDILLDLCVAKYQWFDAAEIAAELEDMLSRQCNAANFGLLSECLGVANACVNKRARSEK